MALILATKLEMTRVIKDSKVIPVTLLQVPELKIIGFKTLDKDGYEAMIVGIPNKKFEGKLKKGNSTLSKNEFSTIKEFEISKEEIEKYKVGDTLSLDLIEDGMQVVLTGTSKGRGFSGAMKRHNFHGGPATHGSKFHRALGSIGNRKPTRTHKGKKMHGHYGTDTVTLKKVPVELVNKELSVIGVRGGVPGARNSLVEIKFN